ncbi:MAG: SprT family zinc-dependent metalloprotease [Candidatus Saganbacteria bacterium]|nr:SprT family zinc-dependent metalloprotease [Candidatus Saganbacteria bacterium]
MTTPKIHKLIRSKRRTIALEITEEATLVVRAPKRAPLEFIEQFVQDKMWWINKHLQSAKEKQQKAGPKQFINGEEFLFLGNKYELIVTEKGPARLSFDGTFQLLSKKLDKARDLFAKWYKKQAEYKLQERAVYYSEVSGLKYGKIKLNSAKKRWGSCTPQGNLNFCWRLIMAPLSVIDYVVVHELSHLAHRNHSRRFWKKVEEILPCYKTQRKWLKENGYMLSW